MKRSRTLERILPRNPEARRLLFLGAGLFVGSVVVTLLVVLATGALRPREADRAADTAEQAPAGPPGAIGLSDLFLLQAPEAPGFRAAPQTTETLLGRGPGRAGGLQEAQAAGQAPPYLLREPRSRWSEEEIQRYWVSLRDIAVDRIRKENDRRIRELFQGVP